MIRILVLSLTIAGAYLQACPVSGTFQKLDVYSIAGNGSGVFQSEIEGNTGSLIPADLSFCCAHTHATLTFHPVEEQAPEFRTFPLLPEVVRIVLMGSGLICLAALWQRRENRRLRRFV